MAIMRERGDMAILMERRGHSYRDGKWGHGNTE